MKTLRVQGKITRDEEYVLTSVKDVETGLEIDTPSTILNLIRLRKKIREPWSENYGFEYTFPFAFSPKYSTNGFKADFPLIFEP